MNKALKVFAVIGVIATAYVVLWLLGTVADAVYVST